VAAFLGAALALHRSPLALLVGLASATAAGVVLLGLRWMRQRVGRDAGLGLGDVKLIAAAGLWLGVATPAMIAIAASLGLLAVLVLRPRDGRIAFGPAIAGATWLIGWLVEYGRWPPVI
jgi:leader peptidase (prepilin peptidase)/N-methyltransferase